MICNLANADEPDVPMNLILMYGRMDHVMSNAFDSAACCGLQTKYDSA